MNIESVRAKFRLSDDDAQKTIKLWALVPLSLLVDEFKFMNFDYFWKDGQVSVYVDVKNRFHKSEREKDLRAYIKSRLNEQRVFSL